MRFKIALYGHPIAEGMWICSGVVSQFSRMGHHPLPVFGLLPLPDGLGCIDVHIIYITHTETVEYYLHIASVTGWLGIREYFLYFLIKLIGIKLMRNSAGVHTVRPDIQKQLI